MANSNRPGSLKSIMANSAESAKHNRLMTHYANTRIDGFCRHNSNTACFVCDADFDYADQRVITEMAIRESNTGE